MSFNRDNKDTVYCTGTIFNMIFCTGICYHVWAGPDIHSEPASHMLLCMPLNISADPSMNEKEARQFLKDHCSPLPTPDDITLEKIEVISKYESCHGRDMYIQKKTSQYLKAVSISILVIVGKYSKCFPF